MPNLHRILVVRLGAMGDIIHTLPAAATLKHSFPGARLTWAVEPRWTTLLEDNPFIDRIVPIQRNGPAALLESWRELHRERYDFAVDFQGLIKSALVASASHAPRIYGFHHTQVRERLAAFIYSNKTISHCAHVVEKNLDLAAAAGAQTAIHSFPLPAGRAEGLLPDGDFVLACPLAGWRSKQWPLENYRDLSVRMQSELGIPLVLNGPAGSGLDHISGIPGLIHATRRAAAVVGVDSGPLHIAAALGKPGVAIFGPTDPSRNGPYGGTLKVLRSDTAITSYKRGTEIDDSMRRIGPAEVFGALKTVLGKCLV